MHQAVSHIESGNIQQEKQKRDTKGFSALTWAVISGNQHLVNKLVELGFDPSVKSKNMNNLLQIAVASGISHMIPILLTPTLHIDPWSKNSFNRTALDW